MDTILILNIACLVGCFTFFLVCREYVDAMGKMLRIKNRDQEAEEPAP